ncbi:isoprenoid synthase domain-containing protein [Penicillium lividum]|nr:isoprenoid synthase domain-containing protein [Penicillium lividum]
MMSILKPDSQKHFVPDSIPVSPESYEREEWFCKFTPRIHRDAHLADLGCMQCQLDLLGSLGHYHAEAVRSGSNKSYAVGCINPTVGNFTALCAVAAIPERLALISYIIEYAFVHDDLIEYAEKKREMDLSKANNQLTEGFEEYGDVRLSARNNVNRQMQAKMAAELLEIDKEQGQVILGHWKEMSKIFVDIRDREFHGLDDYLKFRAVDAGCPWTMSLLCFSMDFYPTAEEAEQTSAITNAGFNAWILVNDYFSWEKEWQNYQATGCSGQIVNAVFLFMKWHNIEPATARRMVQNEIIAREENFCQLKAEYLARGNVTERTLTWFELLERVTAANFAWSMTTARYDADAEDAYPGLRAANQEQNSTRPFSSLSTPITSLDIKAGYEHISGPDSPVSPNSAGSGISDAASTPPTSLDMTKLEESGHLTHLSLSDFEKLGDIENNSPLRCGASATHVVFGVSQTINSANLLLMKAVQSAIMLSSDAVAIVTNRLIDCHIGQGLELHWTNQTKIPTTEDYFTMIDGKTGALFTLIAELMRSEATANKDLDVKPLMKALGRISQVRDDYFNLQDSDHTQKKGFAEDLSEGKISLPLIHTLEANTSSSVRLLSILQHCKAGNSLASGLRKLTLDDIKASGGLEYTQSIILGLQEKFNDALGNLEDFSGQRNWIFRLMKKRLEL